MMKKEQLTEVQEKGKKAICDNMDDEKKKKRKKKRGKQKEETKHDNPTDGEEEDWRKLQEKRKEGYVK